MLENFTNETIHNVNVRGINYAYLKKGSGISVIILHGFPDNAISYTSTMDALAKSNFECFTPFLRGYYPTDLSKDGNYSVKDIAQDILAFADALNIDKFHLIGHDWGASIGYTIALLAPERVINLTAVSIPHPRAIKPSLKLLYQARHFVLFQFHKFSLWYTKRNNFAYIDYIYKWWSPKWNAPKAFTDRIKACYSKPGYLDAALGYYRSFGKDARDKNKAKFSAQKTTVPTLVVVGDSDGALNNAAFENMANCYTNDYEIKWIKDAGHFPHQEKPNEFEDIVVNYLNK